MDSKCTIFYVDDDIDDLNLFRDAVAALAEEKVDVILYDNGHKLIEDLHKLSYSPQLIFIDLYMPETNGFEILEEVKKLTQHQNTPIIIYSTWAELMAISKCKDLGASLYITKPILFEGIIEVIKQVMKIRWDLLTPQFDHFIEQTEKNKETESILKNIFFL